MDPISIILTALVMGAAAGLKPTAEQAVKDLYGGVKRLILSRYPKVDMAVLENDPASKTRQEVLKEDLMKNNVAQPTQDDGPAGAAKDQDILQLAQQLIELVKSKDSQAASVGINIGGNASVQSDHMGGRDSHHTESRSAGRDFYEARDQATINLSPPRSVSDEDIFSLLDALKAQASTLNLPERDQKLVLYEISGARLGAEENPPDLEMLTEHLNKTAQIARKALPGLLDASPFGITLAKALRWARQKTTV